MSQRVLGKMGEKQMNYMPIVMFPKPKKSNRKGLISKADRLFSKLITDRGICQMIAVEDGVRCWGGLDPAHIVSREYKSLRWDPMNALSVCRGHGRWYTDNPIGWEIIMTQYFPKQWNYVQKHKEDVWDKNMEKVLERLV